MPESPPTSAADHASASTLPATLVGALAVIGVLGSAVMAIAHLGIDVPVVGGAVELLPVAISFAVGTVLYAFVAYGAFTRRSWAWALGLVVNGLAFASTAAPPYRGGIEPVAMAVSLAALILLLIRPGREALLYARQRGDT
jgi:hypothetical protein